MNRTNLALEISKLIHNTCDNVPHDIGLQVVALIFGEETEAEKLKGILGLSEKKPITHSALIDEMRKNGFTLSDGGDNFSQFSKTVSGIKHDIVFGNGGRSYARVDGKIVQNMESDTEIIDYLLEKELLEGIASRIK